VIAERAQWITDHRCHFRRRKFIGQVQANRRRLVNRLFTINQHRYQAGGIQL
jgi:hypothetical protein